MREHARHAPVTTNSFLNTKQATTLAAQLLDWLHQQGTDLHSCTQHHIDAWYAHGPTTRKHADRFIGWARRHRINTTIAAPTRQTRNQPTSQALGEAELLTVLRDVLTHDTMPLAPRVAAGLILLYGQPIQAITQLRLDQIELTDQRTQIRLTDDPLDVPEPFATLLRMHLDQRNNRNTAANPSSTWLFPGAMPGKPLTNDHLVTVLRAAGIPALAIRTGTWLSLARQAPPTVLAQTLGISPHTAMYYANQAGTNFLRYANLKTNPRPPAPPR